MRLLIEIFQNYRMAQFGIVLCWDNFNHLSLDKIEKYIREVWKLLRPGGCFIFNYNNCDFEGPTAYEQNARR
jgi:SAM-dependent methyltransferase